jgi:hypothetical protein
MVENSTLHKMFGGFEVEADRLSLTQAQIKQFVKQYPDCLKKGGNGTFFCSRLAVNFSSQPCIFSQTVASGCARAASRSIASSWPRSVIDWWFRGWRSKLNPQHIAVKSSRGFLSIQRRE